MAKVNQTNEGESFKISNELISDSVREVLMTVNFAYICQLIDVVGTATNVVNIICFVKQGFRETINISLLALAVADLVCLVTLLYNNICVNPLFYNLPSIPFNPFEIAYITAGWPHFVFARISACITAFISTERCLCIVFPLNVKTMITRNRVKGTVVCIYVILICSVTPMYYCNRLSWKFHKSVNRSVLHIDPTSDREIIEDIMFAVINVSIPCLTFLVVIVTTAVLVVKLNQKAKWRQESTAQNQSDAMFNRDRMLSKMVIVMSAAFVACYAPVCAIFLAMILEAELSIYGRYKNVFGVVSSIAYIMESINVSINFFIYYKMSSRYRETVRYMFSLLIKQNAEGHSINIKCPTSLNKRGTAFSNKSSEHSFENVRKKKITN